MPSQPERQPAGRPTGGQFAARAHDEGPDLTSVYPPKGSPEWVYGEVKHWASPVIGWIRQDAAYHGPGLAQERIDQLRERLGHAGASVRPDRAEDATTLLIDKLMPAARSAGEDPYGFSAEEFDDLAMAAAAELLAL